MSGEIELGNLKIEYIESDDEIIFNFIGAVDENFKQEQLPRISKESITFDLSGIENFNSCGIREWMHLTRDFSKLGNLKYKDCSVTMIDQINMVPDTAQGASIDSFYAPYYCESDGCVGEVNMLIKRNEHEAELRKHQAPEFKCEKCGNTLDFDALEESYFLFISSDENSKAS